MSCIFIVQRTFEWLNELCVGVRECVCECVCRCIGWAVQAESEKRVARMISSLAALAGITRAGSLLLLLLLPTPACPFALCVWSHWSAAQARFIMGCLLVSTISNNDYWLRLSPVPGRHSPPATLLPQPPPPPPHPVPCVLAVSCPVVSCRVLALYITVCARVGLHNAPFSACRSCLLALLRRLVLLLLLLPLLMMMMLLSSPALTLPLALSMTNENQYLLDYFRNIIRK